MHRAVLILCLLFAALAFTLGINWGLPSRQSDRFLFGDRTPWTGKQILHMLGERASKSLGADVDRDPPARDKPVLLNETDAQRAAIILRYRLYSAQPDEMITFMSLAEMNPRRLELDPRLYQYGGLWIYGVGALVGATLHPIPDRAYYIDHPEHFARFYIVARAYSALFGMIGALCVWWIVNRVTASTVACASAALCYALLPVVNNMAHEAKPHLPGAVLMLLACMGAIRFVETGRRNWWVLTAMLCGAAVGMILSAWPVVFVLPVMVMMRPMRWRHRIIVAIAAAVIAVDVYFIANPYVLQHLLTWNTAENPLKSNLANSRAMYQAHLSWRGVEDAARLFGYAATPIVAALGTIGMVVLLLGREAATRSGSAGARRVTRCACVVMLTPAILVLAQFVLLAAGKPGEYARFGLFPSIVFLITAVAGIWKMPGALAPRLIVLALVLGRVGVGGASYVWNFLRDCGDRPTRLILAERLETARHRGARSIGLHVEPAPYAVPPINLWDWELWYSPWLPRAGAKACDIWLDAVDEFPVTRGSPPDPRAPVMLQWTRPRLLPTPISWAAKPFSVSAPPALLDRTAESAR